jgi:hypothetical protein
VFLQSNQIVGPRIESCELGRVAPWYAETKPWQPNVSTWCTRPADPPHRREPEPALTRARQRAGKIGYVARTSRTWRSQLWVERWRAIGAMECGQRLGAAGRRE